MPTNLDPKEEKEVFKQALKEWLDDRARDFGWWSIKTIAAAGFCAIVYFLYSHGFLFK